MSATIFYVLIMVFQVDDHFAFQAYDVPFPYEQGCKDKGELEARKPDTNMVSWGCERVPLPVRPIHS